ncbi:hypothetical protein Bca52824_017864 [Brassica carinata]|uniref:Agenet domain-containing protein n=1 Tax=Brassica carinata TaxID=52824 RepID=A0A8X8AYT5_BRACI|nr:hypothetical protein Bca52824_017864 [Brassica carinata]
MTHLPLGTQVFSPNLTQEKETETSTDETPSNPNQEEGKPDDETLSSESLTAQTQVLQKETEVTNETPASPIAPKSIETQGFTPIQTQQVHAHKILEISSNVWKLLYVLMILFLTFFFVLHMVTEGTYEATESLTEIISANNKNEDTHTVHNTPSSPTETETATQYFRLKEAGFSSLSNRRRGKVVDLKLCEGPEKLTVEYTTLFADQQRLQDTITADKIRPATPTSDQKSFEMMDKVEVFYNNGWSSGQINMVLGDNTYSVYLYNSMETIQFKHSDLRIHREWRDGVWKMADEKKPDKKRKAAGSSKKSGMDNVFLRRSERVPKRSRDTKTPFKSLSINNNTIKKPFFQSTENATEDLKREHIEGAFAMLNCRRNENAPWFHNYKIPKACFLPMEFLHSLLFHDLIYKKQQVKEKKSNHWIGMAIHLKKRTITLYDCLQTENNDIDIPQVKQLAVLISALLLESFGGEVDKEKILECHSLKIWDMSKINDDNARELRRSLSCEIFNQFVDENFGNYDLQEFPMAFLLWILESVSLLQYEFSQVVPILDVQPSTPIFLCEKYFQVASPRLIDVLLIENNKHMKVTCILPPIPHDPEADVFIEDEDNNGRFIQERRPSLLFGNGGMDQPSSSYQEESLESKINRISEMVEDNFRIINARLCLIEIDRKEIKDRVTELEKLQRVTSYETPNNEADTNPLHETASSQGEANPDQADETLNNEESLILKIEEYIVGRKLLDTREPMNEIMNETPASPIAQQNIETPVLTPIQKQQDTQEPMNEIISPNISYTQPLTRAHINILREQQKMVKVEYSAPSLDENKRKRRVQIRVSIDRIRPQPPPERPGETKIFELLDDVEAYNNGAWCSGKGKAQAVVCKKKRAAGPSEDGVWKMSKEMEVQQTKSMKPSQDDRANKGKPVVGKKKKATAQPVDNLPFLQQEEKRPIGPRNPPMPVTPEVILPIDPFVTPEFPRFSRLAHWMELRGIYCVPLYIHGRDKEKEFFQYMVDAENNLREEHIDAAFEMLNCKRLSKVPGYATKIFQQHALYQLGSHYIGVEIHLMDNTNTLSYLCHIHGACYLIVPAAQAGLDSSSSSAELNHFT